VNATFVSSSVVWKTSPRKYRRDWPSSIGPDNAKLFVPSSAASRSTAPRSRSYSEFHHQTRRAAPPRLSTLVRPGNNVQRFVERTFAWLGRCRRLAKDFENLTRNAWLNLIEGFFSKLARSALRHIRVASKKELKDRIMAAVDDINLNPVIHGWTYKLDAA
jgi:hypothetical protein